MPSECKAKRFDCVKFTREVRAQIDAEIKDMNHEELQAYLDAGPRQHPLWTRIPESRSSDPAKTGQG